MAERPAMPFGADAAEEAARLWHGRFDGVLSTWSAAEPGYPFGSVVPYCTDRRGRPLLLLSHLAQHSQNLAADPRCAFTVLERTGEDVQQGLRLTAIADCVLADEPAALARYARHFPPALAYASELGFRLYRLEPRRFHYNGGFATARWLGRDRILTVSAIGDDTEPALPANADAAAAALWPQARARGAEPVVVAGLDRFGLTLRSGAALCRLDAEDVLADAAAAVAALLQGRFRPRDVDSRA